MATRNIVPRATGEGSLGTNAKKWGDVYANNIHGALIGNATSATSATNDADGNDIASTYAPKDSPAFTGSPTAPTQTMNNNSARIATTAYVVNVLKANAPLFGNDFVTLLNKQDDLNNITTPGTYRWSGYNTTPQNTPSGVDTNYVKMFVFYAQNASYVTQLIFTHAQSYGVWLRTGIITNNTWSSWKRLAYAEDVLPLTGGTMTGAINSTSPLFGGVTFNNEDITSGIQQNHTSYMLSWKDGNNASVCGIYAAMRTGGTVSLDFTVKRAGTTTTKSTGLFVDSSSATFRASTDNDTTLGSSSLRWKQLYAATTTIATSDERLKDNIVAIPDEVLDAWGEVGWYQYQFKDSIEEKGENARLHTGAIAQRIESIFSAHGLDASRYGLLCYDAWKAEPAEYDEDGNIVQPTRPAGNRYSLRYEEALCMEAAYQRRRADRLEQRIARLESLINNIEK